MDDKDETNIDHPERLCNAIISIIDELESSNTIEETRAAELRSEIYRSIDIPEE